jgi:hypothetical protein
MASSAFPLRMTDFPHGPYRYNQIEISHPAFVCIDVERVRDTTRYPFDSSQGPKRSAHSLGVCHSTRPRPEVQPCVWCFVSFGYTICISLDLKNLFMINSRTQLESFGISQDSGSSNVNAQIPAPPFDGALWVSQTRAEALIST